MATILRVKRKKEDEPLDALLVACKRQKIESDKNAASDPLTALVKFAGTLEKEDDCVIKHITKSLTKDALKDNFKQHIVDITKKVREKTKQDSSENRYKILNSIRMLDTSSITDLEEDVIHIIDIEDTKANIPDNKSNDGYVYDLYYTQTEEVIQVENLVSVLPVEENLVFEEYYKDNEESQFESEDSNSESNWRNDYPDSDHSEGSIGENDIRNAIKNMNVDDDLSSDSDDFVYGLDEDDVERYGHKYAKYKARMKKEKEEYDNCSDVHIDISENDGSDADESELSESDTRQSLYY